MLNKHNLNIAELCSKTENRFVLNAVYVTPTYTVETDGHQLVIVSCPAPVEDFKPFLLGAADAKLIAKALPRNPKTVAASAAVTRNKSIATSTQVFQPSPVDGRFPDFERLVPNPADAKYRIGVDPGLLRRVLAQIESFTASVLKPSVRMYFDTELNAIRMDADGGDGQHLTALLMPMRVEWPDAEPAITRKPMLHQARPRALRNGTNGTVTTEDAAG